MVAVRFEGGDKVAAALSTLSTRLSRQIVREALREGADPMAETAASLAPKGDPATPNLSDNIAVSNARPDDGSVGLAVGPTKGVFYGSFQELGTRHHAAQPFLRPAFDREAKPALGTIGASLWAALIRRGVTGTRGGGGGVGV
jgi:HK97 gp10 family phage protein